MSIAAGRNSVPYLARLAVIALAYFMAGNLGLMLPGVHPQITLLWLPSGIALAALLRWGYRYWPAVFLGAFLVNFAVTPSFSLAASIALTNTLAPMLAVCLLRYLDFRPTLERASDVMLLVVVGAAGMLLSASGGVASLLLHGRLGAELYSSAWLNWWVGDAMGVLLISPLLLSLSREELARLWQQRLDFLLWLALAGFAVWLVMAQWKYADIMVILFMLPLAIWAAMCYRIMGSSLAILCLALLVATAVASDHALRQMTHEDLFALWIMLSLMMVITLMITALQAQHQQALRALHESETRMRAVIDAALDAIVTIDSGGRITEFNPAAERIFGYARQQVLGKDMGELIVPGFLRERHSNGARNFFSTGEKHIFDRRLELTAMRADGSEFPMELTVTALRLQGQPLVTGFMRDITEAKQAEQKLQQAYENLARQNMVLDAISQHQPLKNIFDSLALAIEKQYPEMLCSVLLLDQPSGSLRFCSAPSLPDFYNQALDGLPVNAHEGACGAAAFEGRRVIVEDIEHHPDMAKYIELTRRANLRACWSEPILSHNRQVLGTLAIYHRQPKMPDPQELAMISESARLAGLAIERFNAEQDLLIAANAFEVDQGIVVMNAERVILRVNQAYCRLTGNRPEEVIGGKPSMLIYGQQDEAFYEEMWQMLQENRRWQGELWDRRKNGDTYMQSLNITAVTNDAGVVTNYVASFADITQHIEAEQQIRRLAYYDPLTHLPNRLLLIDRLSQAIVSAKRNKRRGAVLFIDLDNFKTLNDTRGHHIGDLLLVEVGKRLLDCVRAEDTVARIGGDEFVVVLEDLGADDTIASANAQHLAEKIIHALGRRYQLQGQDYHTTPSIGVILFNAQPQKVEELLKRADSAMYQAKNAGRNTLRFYDPLIQAALEARSELEAELRLALDHGELQLNYQAQVDHERTVLGAEVLLRWKHPRHGIIQPQQFIAMAEETGLIVPIGLWVLEKACAQLKRWEAHAATRHLKLAVNVSARQFRQPDFSEQVRNIVRNAAIQPDRLKLELTESLVLDNVSDAIEKMMALKPLGIGFSMDDFGTGQSSLMYLKKLPLTQLKIDQSFVRDITSDPNDAVIVKTIIGMSINLGLEIIAEGVETEPQLQFLQDNGCLAYQGYLFGKPMLLDDFERSLSVVMPATPKKS